MKITKTNINDVFKSKKVSVETMELKGYELIEEFFVDSSGWGASDELALTKDQFMQKMTELLEKHGSFYTTITNAGQFQVYVGCFRKGYGVKMSHKIANNTIEINKDGKRIIRFHDTDIMIFEGDKITLNNGGWATVTTKQRMNEYLLGDYYITQKDFNWYVINRSTGEKIGYKNNMVLTIKQ